MILHAHKCSEKKYKNSKIKNKNVLLKTEKAKRFSTMA